MLRLLSAKKHSLSEKFTFRPWNSALDKRTIIRNGGFAWLSMNICKFHIYPTVALRVLNQLFDIWLFFNSLFLSPCKVFLFCFFGDFFPLFRFRGRPLATYYLYLRYFDILLWMGRGIGRFCLWGGSGYIFMIYLVFFSVI